MRQQLDEAREDREAFHDLVELLRDPEKKRKFMKLIEEE